MYEFARFVTTYKSRMHIMYSVENDNIVLI